MATVHTFWWTLEEDNEFIGYCRGQNLFGVEDRHVRDAADLKVLPIDRLTAQGCSQMILASQSYFDSCCVEKVTKSSQELFGYDLMDGNFICFRRASLQESILRRANLCYYRKTANGESKPKEFYLFARRIFTWAKNRTPQKATLRGFDYPASSMVMDLLKEGRISIDL